MWMHRLCILINKICEVLLLLAANRQEALNVLAIGER